MKVLTLNTWRGDAGANELIAFLKEQAKDVDVFCLQEVWWAPEEGLSTQTIERFKIDISRHEMQLGQLIADALSDYQPFFTPQFTDNYGLLTLVKNNIEVVDSGSVFVYKDNHYLPPPEQRGNHGRNFQYVTLHTNAGVRTTINLHGIWCGPSKLDTPERLTQSDIIVDFIQKHEHPVVFVGDFNLEPETESIKRFEAIGLQNLIRKHGVTSTRTSLFNYPVKFADYIFVSPELRVADFAVLPDVVSDHAPLTVEIVE